MRGVERGGHRRDPDTKAMIGKPPKDQIEDPNTLAALADLVRLVGRSGAPQLRLRLVLAILLTLAGKALGVVAPLVLGAAVNHLARDQPGQVAVGLGFAGFAVGWALVRFLSSVAPQISDVIFAPVRAAAQRTTAAETFAHALVTAWSCSGSGMIAGSGGAGCVRGFGGSCARSTSNPLERW